MGKNVIITVLVLILVIAGIGYWSVKDAQKKSRETAKRMIESPNSKVNQDPNSDIILFYGEECPHCKDLDQFLEENKIGEKVSFAHLEIWHNTKNADIMVEKAKTCQIPEEELGVPFLFARGECLIGAPDIEEFFQKEVQNTSVDNSGE